MEGAEGGTGEREKRRPMDSAAVKRQRKAFFVLFNGISFTIRWKNGQGCIKYSI